MIDANSYSDTNIIGTIHVLKCMVECGINILVFSSSAAVYGTPIYTPLDENHPTQPINYYGETKLIMEKIMKWYSAIYKIKFSALRYFNAAGHTPDTDITIIEKNPQNLFL